jgi:hypothetical protein
VGTISAASAARSDGRSIAVRRRLPLLVLLPASLLSACSGSPTSPDAESLSVTPVAYRDAAHEVFLSETMEIVRDPSTWQGLWSRMTSNELPAPILPAVDFANNMLVVAAVGTQVTGGYGVSVTAASYQSYVITVQVTVWSAGPGCNYTQAITSPVAIAMLPARTGAATFQVTRKNSCQ